MPKRKRPPRIKLLSKRGQMKFHVCIPLYHGIPKEAQSGWTRMGETGVQEWNNTTNITEWVLRIPKFDHKLYCGTCGRIMVKNKSNVILPLADAKVIKLV